jgi:hypothetical protein
MSAKKPCLRCGQEMDGHWSHICPGCGRFFAVYTPAQITVLIVVITVMAIGVNAALVVALWQFA